jgi:uncharacterized membrane protein YozB (DUF420 family)
VLTGPEVILLLKLAVTVVTVLLLIALVAVARGHVRLHGQINRLFFLLTMTTVVGFEVLIRLVSPRLFDYMRQDPELNRILTIHLSFAVPSALLLPVMLYSGLRHHRRLHLTVATVFGMLWLGTFVTGVFFLRGTGP